MAQITVEEIKKHADVIVATFADGFQIADLFKVIPMAMEIVEKVSGASGEEKKATALEIINYVIDAVDLPWVPDNLVDPILKKLAPTVIELVISASKGELGVNKPQ
jgi:molybdopterin-guanine dinucleotide biosynthesis protein A